LTIIKLCWNYFDTMRYIPTSCDKELFCCCKLMHTKVGIGLQVAKSVELYVKGANLLGILVILIR